MTYGKGERKIYVEKIDGFGKYPGLWVGDGNCLIKLASFGSYEKADIFQKYLEYFLFGTPIESEGKEK